MDADVVAAVLPGEVLAGRGEGDARPRRQLGPKHLRSQLLHQVPQPARPAVLAVAQLVEELRHGPADLHRLLGPHEDVDVGSQARSVRQPPAHQQVEPGRAVPEPGRDQRQVVDLRLRAILATPGHAHLELARQIGILPVAGEKIADRRRDRVGVDHLVGVDPGHRAAEHVARRIAARLHGGDADRLQPPPDLRHRPDPDPVQLDVLPGRQVEIPVPPDRVRLRAASVLVGDLPDQPRLRRRQPAAGDLHPQHEGVAALPLRIEPDPLQPLRLPIDRRDRRRPLPRIRVENRLLHLQRMPRRLPPLDLIQLLVMSPRRCRHHRSFIPRRRAMQASLLLSSSRLPPPAFRLVTPAARSSRSGSESRTPSSPAAPTTNGRRAGRRPARWGGCRGRSRCW